MKKTTAVANCSEGLATLEEILHHGRENKKHTNAEFNCRVAIKGVRNSEEWFRLMCGGGKCMKGVSREHGELWCAGCENPVMFPQPRFHLELEVLDSTANAVIMCFDDTAQILTNTTAASILNAESGLSHIYTAPVIIQNSDGSISTLPNCLHSLVGTTRTIQVDTSTYYHHGAFESFNCKRVLPDETNCESVGSTSPTPMTRKGKGVMTIPTPVKLKETIRKYIPTYEGSDSDDSVGNY
ncbi:putative nucleic acid-binding, replication factor A [Helianthus annuus]|nr:putative nucleic acid-binding, replication factor A [Helianthus annuus]